MKTVAIITEYNPFHFGHLHQLSEIKAAFGADTRIIAVMSGNYTQRGEIAIADKSVRAKAAVDSGIDLVLELPFPYSSSSAEFFAFGGVSILNSLGIVDALIFGSESGDIEWLCERADILSSEKFLDEIKKLGESPDNKELGYPALCELALKNISPLKSEGLFSPNNILALEYIKSLKRLNSNITPVTFKRISSSYSSVDIIDGKIQSASAIRPLMNDESIQKALSFIPKNAQGSYLEAYESGLLPTVPANLDSAIISFLRLNSPDEMKSIHDAGGGLYNRLHDASFEVTSISALINSAETKKYTTARIRRAIWNSYFGVTSSVIRSKPSYTQVLGMNKVGCAMLKEIKKKTDFPVITKPSSYHKLGDDVIRQKVLSDKADSIFALAQKTAVSGRSSIKMTPYVKKS